jgi:hypothetical protein
MNIQQRNLRLFITISIATTTLLSVACGKKETAKTRSVSTTTDSRRG